MRPCPLDIQMEDIIQRRSSKITEVVMKALVVLLFSCSFILSSCDEGLNPQISESLPYDPSKEDCFVVWGTFTMNFPPFNFYFMNPAISPDGRYIAGTTFTFFTDIMATVGFNVVFDLIENKPVVKDLVFVGGKFSWNRTGSTVVSSQGQIWRRGSDRFEYFYENGHAIRGHMLSWSPTSDNLYFFGTSAAGKRGLHRMPNANGHVETLFEMKNPFTPWYDFEMLDDDRLVFQYDSSHYILDLRSMTYTALPTAYFNSRERQGVVYDTLPKHIGSSYVMLSYNRKQNKLASFYQTRTERGEFGIGIYDFGTQAWKRIWEIPNSWRAGYGYNVGEGIQLLDNGNVLVNLYCKTDETYIAWEISSTTGKKVRQWTSPEVNYYGE